MHSRERRRHVNPDCDLSICNADRLDVNLADDDTVGEKLHGRIRELYPDPAEPDRRRGQEDTCGARARPPAGRRRDAVGNRGLRLGRPARMERPRRLDRGAGGRRLAQFAESSLNLLGLQRPGRRHAAARRAPRARLHRPGASRPRPLSHLVLGRALGLLHDASARPTRFPPATTARTSTRRSRTGR